eukprot:SAG22_NODE_975_length_6203_cov_25.423001_2_plen_113_part_00
MDKAVPTHQPADLGRVCGRWSVSWLRLVILHLQWGIHAIVAFSVPAVLALAGVNMVCSTRASTAPVTIPHQPQELQSVDGSAAAKLLFGTMTSDGDGSAAEYVPLAKASVSV